MGENNAPCIVLGAADWLQQRQVGIGKEYGTPFNTVSDIIETARWLLGGVHAMAGGRVSGLRHGILHRLRLAFLLVNPPGSIVARVFDILE